MVNKVVYLLFFMLVLLSCGSSNIEWDNITYSSNTKIEETNFSDDIAEQENIYSPLEVADCRIRQEKLAEWANEWFSLRDNAIFLKESNETKEAGNRLLYGLENINSPEYYEAVSLCVGRELTKLDY